MTKDNNHNPESVVREIRRKTRKKYSSEEKIRIVLEGLKGEESIAAICRREGIVPNLYYRWSKDFLEAGKKRLQGDTVREANSVEVNSIKRENEQLRDMIAYQESRPDLELLVVDVIGANPDVWEQTIQIGAGYSDGLQEYMAVLNEDGNLVGRIILCTSEASVVQLITDDKSSVGAMLQKNAEMGIVKGEGGGGVRLELLNQDAEVSTGDEVITSGLGGTCPSGIKIGTITEISERRADLSVGIVIAPKASLTRLDRVMVVMSPVPSTSPVQAALGGG